MIPPLNVANPVNVDVDCAANTPENVPVVPDIVVNIAFPLAEMEYVGAAPIVA